MLCMLLDMCETEEQQVKFKEIYRRYRYLIKYVVMKYFYNNEDAEDAEQESFIAIVKNLDKINLKSCDKTKNYIVIITKSTCLNILKSRKRNVDTVEYDEQKAEIPDDLESTEPLTVSISKHNLERLKSMIDELDEIYKIALTFKYLLEYSDKKIAEELNITESAVRMRIMRGKALLKQKLEAERGAEV